MMMMVVAIAIIIIIIIGIFIYVSHDEVQALRKDSCKDNECDARSEATELDWKQQKHEEIEYEDYHSDQYSIASYVQWKYLLYDQSWDRFKAMIFWGLSNVELQHVVGHRFGVLLRTTLVVIISQLDVWSLVHEFDDVHIERACNATASV